ncbi:ribokinase [Oceanobacillus jeddahense]|uniref:Ribokinase n=1 Tax=Oceanobacillus jeddahense TaxID=1462527 RepID=A0ABY5JS83_9BACI|nr:ribokinase [Oceanobacillus jeddahense]UUI02986.1 ribokinase [Oceanobacillus jeddahense]
MGNKKILVIGSYNVGLACRTERIPVWGETLLAKNFSESNGGKGANQAVAASKLGGDVSFVGCLGNDKFGNDGLNMLKEQNVDISTIFRSDKHTGVGFILLNNEGENCILVDSGANNDLVSEEVINAEKIENSDIVVFQLENNLALIEDLMKHAYYLGKTTILNPAPANKDAKRLLKYANIVNPNETELLLLNNEDLYTKLDDKMCEELARNLLKQGPEYIIITRGAKGAMIVSSNKCVEIKGINVSPIDTTGAGDSFTGGLAVALSEGKTIEDSVNFANYVGAYSVTKRDVIPSLPTRNEVNNFKYKVSVNN